MSDFLISIDELKLRIGTADCPPIFDVRRRALYDTEDAILPTARWRDHLASDLWSTHLPGESEVIAYCVHAHNVSQCAVAALRARGVRARVLQDGIEGWKAAGGLTISKSALPLRDEDLASVWVTAVAPDVDQLACAWFVRRFVDRDATFLFVEPEQVLPVAEEVGGVALDVPGATFVSNDRACTLDVLLERFAISQPALDDLSNIVRGAAGKGSAQAPQSAGLSAICRGLSALSGDDGQAALARARAVFDALYASQNGAVPLQNGRHA